MKLLVRLWWALIVVELVHQVVFGWIQISNPQLFDEVFSAVGADGPAGEEGAVQVEAMRPLLMWSSVAFAGFIKFAMTCCGLVAAYVYQRRPESIAASRILMVWSVFLGSRILSAFFPLAVDVPAPLLIANGWANILTGVLACMSAYIVFKDRSPEKNKNNNSN